MPERLVGELRTISPQGKPRPLKEARGTYAGLDRQALRGLRLLDEDSAHALLDGLGQLKDVVYGAKVVHGEEQETL